MKLSEWIKENGDCEVSEELFKMVKKKKSGKWMPKNGEQYWFINDRGRTDWQCWNDAKVDNYCRDFLRIFKTKEECERFWEIHEAFNNASFEPDWRNDDQRKYLFMTYINNYCDIFSLRIDYYLGTCHGSVYYFESEEICRDLINRFGEKDILKYIFGIEE